MLNLSQNQSKNVSKILHRGVTNLNQPIRLLIYYWWLQPKMSHFELSATKTLQEMCVCVCVCVSECLCECKTDSTKQTNTTDPLYTHTHTQIRVWEKTSALSHKTQKGQKEEFQLKNVGQSSDLMKKLFKKILQTHTEDTEGTFKKSNSVWVMKRRM